VLVVLVVVVAVLAVVVVALVVVVVVVVVTVGADRRISALPGVRVTEVVEDPLGSTYVPPSANVWDIVGLGSTRTVPPLKLRRQPTPT
jgi:hypothetical protein